jgi:membrane associated rhomboid family serine protease
MTQLRKRLADAGIRRAPRLTLTVFVLTAVPSCAQAVLPSVLPDLERTPAGLTGQWWRSLTSLTVQDGGVLGTLSNLLFLLAIGAIAEQVLTRPRWLALYLLPGLAGEFVAYSWQPTGGGNSVAISGLAGALAVLMLRDGLSPSGALSADRRQRVPAAVPYALLLWAGVLVATASEIAGGLIVAATCVLPRLAASRLAAGRPLPVAGIAGTAVLACGVTLAADQDIHGAALLVGALLGAAVARPGYGSAEPLRALAR